MSCVSIAKWVWGVESRVQELSSQTKLSLDLDQDYWESHNAEQKHVPLLLRKDSVSSRANAHDHQLQLSITRIYSIPCQSILTTERTDIFQLWRCSQLTGILYLALFAQAIVCQTFFPSKNFSWLKTTISHFTNVTRQRQDSFSSPLPSSRY